MLIENRFLDTFRGHDIQPTDESDCLIQCILNINIQSHTCIFIFCVVFVSTVITVDTIVVVSGQFGCSMFVCISLGPE